MLLHPSLRPGAQNCIEKRLRFSAMGAHIFDRMPFGAKKIA